MSFKPTKEQERIFTFIKKRPENILIEAFAGAGKTSTLVEAIKLLPKDNISIMFLAFNKHIQEELKTKLPEHVRTYTSHGLGLSALKRKYGDKIKMDEFKIDKIIKKKSSGWDLNSEFKSIEKKNKYLGNIKKLVNLCKLTMTLNVKYVPFVAEKYNIDIKSTRDIKRVLKVLDASTQDRSTFDFTDMVYLPAIDPSIWMFPQDYVVVDECQDLNRCQIRLIEKSLRKDKVFKKVTGRLIGVGDVFQSIYGFNGADDKSFDWFRKFPNTKILPLSYSFRCSKNVIKRANVIVPNIKALDDAPDGIVRDGDVVNEANDGDFILCRTTKPLVKLYFTFLLKNKKAMIKGSDIGVHLIELIGKTKDIGDLISFWNVEMLVYRKELRKSGILNPLEHSGYVALDDKVSTLLFLGRLSNSIEDLISKIKMIFSDKISGIMLSTVHKVKGLEADRVFIVRPDLMPLPFNNKQWQIKQEKNLEYVAITRAKNELIYDYEWTDEEENEKK